LARVQDIPDGEFAMSGRIGRCTRWSARLCLFAAVASFAVSAMPTAALAQTKVRYVEVVRNLAYLPSYVAMAKGYFKDEGLDISLTTAQGGEKAAAMILSGGADITLVGPEVVVYVRNSESPEKMKIFCALTGTPTNFIMSRKKIAPGDFKWPMLKGATFLGWRPGSTPELFLEYAMHKNGIDAAKDLKLLTNIGVPARMGAWLSGTGDFSIFSEPEATVIEREGKGYRAGFVGKEIGRVDYTLFAATQSYIAKNPKVIQGFTNAIYKAQRDLKSADPQQIGQIVAEFFPGVTPAQIAEVVQRYREVDLWPADPAVYEASINTLQDILIHGGVQKPDQRVKYSDVVTNTFADAAKAAVK
jgi:NitT/TauT family transport system substrate-binding protein